MAREELTDQGNRSTCAVHDNICPVNSRFRVFHLHLGRALDQNKREVRVVAAEGGWARGGYLSRYASGRICICTPYMSILGVEYAFLRGQVGEFFFLQHLPQFCVARPDGYIDVPSVNG